MNDGTTMDLLILLLVFRFQSTLVTGISPFTGLK